MSDESNHKPYINTPEAAVPAPFDVFKIDGTEHEIGNPDCCAVEKCAICCNLIHFQGVYGGYVKLCESCDTEKIRITFSADLIPDAETLANIGLPSVEEEDLPEEEEPLLPWIADALGPENWNDIEPHLRKIGRDTTAKERAKRGQ